MAISDRRKIVAALTLAAGGFGLIGVSSGAVFTDTVAGSFTVTADFPVPTATATATASAGPTAEPTVSASGTPADPSPSATGSTAPASPPPTTTAPPKTAALTTAALNPSDWFTNSAPDFAYKNKEIKFTGSGALMIGGFTARNTGQADLKVTASVTLPAGLKGKVTAEVRPIGAAAVLKAGDSAKYELWLTPVKSGDTVAKDLAAQIHFVLAYTAV
ncbi:hypothetical protein ACFV06_31080 [Streptomyces sp. NPDC059618]|uniref:hypothetical protein n=1 Tax=Streptomyces sp. NPDC059618 TaxID=3346887 RepID=UPI0036A05F77